MRLAFRSVEDLEWKRLCKMQNPLFPLPSATFLSTHIRNTMLNEVKAKLMCDLTLDSKVAISLDCWSSTTRLSFMAIMVYYIDKDWKYREELIGFENLREVHDGHTLATVLNKVFDEYNLRARIIAVTTDNASNNSTMMVQVNEWLDDAFEKKGFLSGILHLPCLAHVFQLGLSSLLGTVRLRPNNEEFEKNWREDEELKQLQGLEKDRGLPYTLAKV
jgi:hypothetical protein